MWFTEFFLDIGKRMRTESLPNCTIGFVYNEPCPLKCNFCCHTKENVGPGKLTPANVTPVMVKYAKHPQVTRFAFTGGDPFLYVDQIIQIASEARISGVCQPFHIVTSGYWAESDAVVDRRLKALAKIGMDMLYVSYDLEHMKWVPDEYVYRIEEFCDKYDIILSVYGVFWEPGTTVRDLLPRLRTKHTNQNLVAPIGRAREHKNLLLPNAKEEDKYSCGKPLDYDITIYPNGDTYPCCSGGFNKEAKLLLGNSFIDDPEDLIARCYSNFFVTIAKELGFDKLYEAVSKSGISVPVLPKFSEVTSVCEVCSAIHSSAAAMKKLQPVMDTMEIEYCTNRFNSIVAALEEEALRNVS